MKAITLFISLLLIACTSKEDQLVPNDVNIIGKWAPTYQTQTRNADGTWGEWHQINTFVALPVYEFTSDGRFLTDGKPGANCCFAGNKYSVSGSKISFTEIMSCPTVYCVACADWTISEMKSDSLILEQCSARNKYIKTK
ncbi:MAG: hypothetical protein V4585_00675 [Bacteroidota bacterium]|jgi:hypothetical protein